MHGVTRLFRIRGPAPNQYRREELAIHHRQPRRSDKRAMAAVGSIRVGRPGAFRLMDAAPLRDRPLEDPGRQGCRHQGLPRGDIVSDPLGHLGPTGQLPELEGALAPAEAPTHGEIEFARTRRDLGQMNRCVLKAVAHHRPQKTRLRIGRFAQQL